MIYQMKFFSRMKEQKPETTSNVMNVYHLIVLDESGSMSCVTKQTISGCNETLNTIRKMQHDNSDTQRHFVSIYLFDTDRKGSRYIRKDTPIDDVADVTGRDYRPCGSTPLFDALGLTLYDLSLHIEPQKAAGYVTIITDGYENSSVEYGIQVVKKLIDTLKKKGVVFSFIGANIDAHDFGGSLHIDNCLQFDQDEEGMHAMFERESRSKMRSSRRLNFMQKFKCESVNEFFDEENSGNYYTESDRSNIAPAHIDHLNKGQVFVFGSNIQGMHSGGAARAALQKFGAVMGQAEGLQGQSYAIPTVGVSETDIYLAVSRFTEFAAQHPEMEFLVTEIGCGTAGWTVKQIAPMFMEAMRFNNVKVPQSFWEYNNGDFAI